MALTAQFKEFTSLPYPQQAQAFANAYWDELFANSETNKENLWKWVHIFAELDLENKMEGKDLDEFNAHRFLEKVGETKRVVELREELKQIDLNFDKRVALLEFLLYHYKKQVPEFLSKPQGDNSKEIEKAQAMLDEVQKALDIATERAAQAKADADASKARAAEAAASAEEASRRAEAAAASAAKAKAQADAAAASAAEAKAKADEARAKHEEAAAAEAEQRAALAEVQAQEKARDEKTAALKQKSEDESIGLVARQRAKNELAQHLAEDPLPLRKSKITLEAATKKAEKARAIAEEAKNVAEAAQAAADADAAQAKAAADAAEADRLSSEAAAEQAQRDKEAAEEAARVAEESAKAAQAAQEETLKQFAAAQAFLEEVKSKSGTGQGTVWWLQRELEEKKKYMPKSKGGTWTR